MEHHAFFEAFAKLAMAGAGAWIAWGTFANLRRLNRLWPAATGLSFSGNLKRLAGPNFSTAAALGGADPIGALALTHALAFALFAMWTSGQAMWLLGMIFGGGEISLSSGRPWISLLGIESMGWAPLLAFRAAIEFASIWGLFYFSRSCRHRLLDLARAPTPMGEAFAREIARQEGEAGALAERDALLAGLPAQAGAANRPSHPRRL